MEAYLWQVSGSMLLFYAFYILLLKHETFFHLNRFYLLDSLLASLTLPLLATVFTFEEANGMAAATTIWLQEIQVGVGSTVPAYLDWQAWLAITYVSGATFMAIRLALRLYRLWQYISRLQGRDEKGYRLLHTEGKLPTFSFLHYVFWDNTLKLSDEETAKILRHELAHVQGRHSYDMLFLELLKVVFWFNPAVYWYQNALAEQHEYAADAAVLKTCNRYDYSQLMLKTFFTQMQFAFIHNFNHSPIKKRIMMMNKTKTPGVKTVKLLLAVPLAALMLVFYACENDSSPVTDEEITLEHKMEIVEGEGANTGDISDQVFEIVEKNAQPVGGLEQLYQYIAEEITYPESAKKDGLEGKVYVQFIINKDGSISQEDVKVMKGFDPACDAVAAEVIKNMPAWEPGEQRGQKIRQRMILPINFKLTTD